MGPDVPIGRTFCKPRDKRDETQTAQAVFCPQLRLCGTNISNCKVQGSHLASKLQAPFLPSSTNIWTESTFELCRVSAYR